MANISETNWTQDDIDILFVCRKIAKEINKGKDIVQHLTFSHDPDDLNLMNMYKGVYPIVKHANVRELYYALTAIKEYGGN